MAVKVMVAPAIANGGTGNAAPTKRAGAAAKPKRRRSSVYDADGNEVFITLMCLKCHKMRPLSQFGLRKMADGAIRNQPWCRTCRSAAGADKPRRRGAAETGDSPEIGASSASVQAPPQAVDPASAVAEAKPPIRRPGSTVAAEVAAALAAGMRR